jgi:hypothetical protein
LAKFNPTKANGSRFYRYQSPILERLKPVILEHTLYLPGVAQLNDPFDCRPKIAPMSEEEMVTFLRNDYIRRNRVVALDLLTEHESKIRQKIQLLGMEWFQHQLTDILNSQMESFRVYSMTRRFDNWSLWASYAANHTGYCLEFANEGALFGDHSFDVIYGEYPPFDLNAPAGEREAAFLVYKRPEWSNEEEVRLIAARGSVPFAKIEPRWLSRIILGKDMTPENRNQIREWAVVRDPKLVVAQAQADSLRQELHLES